jgi:hypothetical protein
MNQQINQQDNNQDNQDWKSPDAPDAAQFDTPTRGSGAPSSFFPSSDEDGVVVVTSWVPIPNNPNSLLCLS